MKKHIAASILALASVCANAQDFDPQTLSPVV